MLLCCSRLLPFFFRRHGGIDLEHALRQIHSHLPLRDIHTFQVRFGEGNVEPLAGSGRDNQQRRFTRAKLNICDAANFPGAIKYDAADQIADITPPAIKLRAFGRRNLQLRSDQSFGGGHRIHAAKLQNYETLVRPKIFHFQLTPGVWRLAESEQLHPRGKAIGNIAMYFGRDLAVPALRLHYAGQRNELAASIRAQSLAYSMISRV